MTAREGDSECRQGCQRLWLVVGGCVPYPTAHIQACMGMRGIHRECERYTSGVSVVHIGSVRGTHRECIHWCEWYTSEMDFSSDLMVYMKQGQIYTKRYTRMHTLVSGVYIENAPSLQLFLPHIAGQKPRIKKLCGRFILLHTQPYTRTNAHARPTAGERG